MFIGGIILAYSYDEACGWLGVIGVFIFVTGSFMLFNRLHKDMKRDCYMERKEQRGDTAIIYKIKIPCDSIKIIKQ